jgi:hypothetical protein
MVAPAAYDMLQGIITPEVYKSVLGTTEAAQVAAVTDVSSQGCLLQPRILVVIPEYRVLRQFGAWSGRHVFLDAADGFGSGGHESSRGVDRVGDGPE